MLELKLTLKRNWFLNLTEWFSYCIISSWVYGPILWWRIWCEVSFNSQGLNILKTQINCTTYISCNFIFIPPQTVCVGRGRVILFSRRPSIHLSVRVSIYPSVTFWFFLNILKRQWWKLIKLCRHIYINKMYVYNRKLRFRGQFCWSYCPL